MYIVYGKVVGDPLQVIFITLKDAKANYK